MSKPTLYRQCSLSRTDGAYCESGQECSERTYKTLRKERTLKIILINHAQAAKWSGDNQTAMRIVTGTDWSGSAPEFRIAVACLKEDWDDATDLMRQVGKNSKYLPIHAYDGWPIFRQFRKTPQFLSTFLGVFGVEFADEARRAGAEAVKPSIPTDPPEKLTAPPDKETDHASGPDKEIDNNPNGKEAEGPRS